MPLHGLRVRPTSLVLEALSLGQGLKTRGTALDAAGLEAIAPNFGCAVAQVLLGVLKEGPTDGLLPLDVVASVSRGYRRRKGVDEEGRETHGEPWGLL